MQRLLTTTILVGLLVATAAAFAVTERLKLTKSPIFDTVVYPKNGFSPKCGCARGKATVRIKLRHADLVSVSILDAKKSPVRSLADGVHVSRGLNVFRWDGRTDGNVIAKDGTYKAEIHLSGQHRTIVLPNEILLDTTAPAVTSVAANRDAFSPDGDHQADFIRIRYELSKPAHVNLYLDGNRILRTYRHPATGSFSWFGRANGAALPPGSYTLDVGAVDAAGKRFSIGVSTDATRYTWKLGARKSFAVGPVLRLKASTRHGRYTLTVSERGHVDRATVLVR